MLRPIFSIFGLVLALSTSARASFDWDRLLEPGAGISFGVSLLGPWPYERNAGTTFRPASTSKLFTAVAALELLGPEFRYETRLSWRRVEARDPGVIQDLVLVGSGDPSWGLRDIESGLTSRIDALVKKLASEGTREARGAVRVEGPDSRWDRVSFPEAWEASDLSFCYGAAAGSFNLQENCASFEVSGRTTGKWIQPGVPISVTLAISAGRSTSVRATAIRNSATGAISFRVSGTWKSGSRPVRLSLPVHDSAAWARNLLIRSLRTHGIAVGSARIVEAEIRVGQPRIHESEAEPLEWEESIPADSRVLGHAGTLLPIIQDEEGVLVLRSLSPPLREIIKPLEKHSVNLVAEAVFKTLGARLGDPSLELYPAGIRVMSRYLDGIDGVELKDGSGLSRESRCTPAGMLAFLNKAKQSPAFPHLWASLPIAGVDGTLETRMRGTAAHGKLRAKTGTLNGAYQLAGYVPSDDDGYVPFVIFTRTTTNYRARARSAQDRVGAALAEQVSGDVRLGN